MKSPQYCTQGADENHLVVMYNTQHQGTAGLTQAGHGLLLIFPILEECSLGRQRAAAVCGLTAQTHQFHKKLSKLSFITLPRVDSLNCHTNEGFPYFYPFSPALFISVCQYSLYYSQSSSLSHCMSCLQKYFLFKQGKVQYG